VQPGDNVSGPDSNDQMVEFLPATLSEGRFNSSHDLAMIGMGRTGSIPCFRWNFYGVSLGCASDITRQDCHFEIWALRYNEATGRDEFTGASEDAMTIACTEPTCELTPKMFSGYQDLSSIVIRVKSDNKIRVWWADDVQVGWTDNTCEAAWCRAWGDDKTPQSMRRGELYLFTSNGIQRIRHPRQRRG
jgi:collagen type III alpha